MARILVVDDEAMIRKFLFQSLGMLGHDVIAVVDGEDGMHQATESQPHLVITDVDMPGNEEGRFIYALRSRRPALPVIVMSGSNDHDFTPYRESGCLALTKPFSLSQLYLLIRQVLESRPPDARSCAS